MHDDQVRVVIHHPRCEYTGYFQILFPARAGDARSRRDNMDCIPQRISEIPGELTADNDAIGIPGGKIAFDQIFIDAGDLPFRFRSDAAHDQADHLAAIFQKNIALDIRGRPLDPLQPADFFLDRRKILHTAFGLDHDVRGRADDLLAQIIAETGHHPRHHDQGRHADRHTAYGDHV